MKRKKHRKKQNQRRPASAFHFTEEDVEHAASYMALVHEMYEDFFGHPLTEAMAHGDSPENLMKITSSAEMILVIADEAGSYEEARDRIRCMEPPADVSLDGFVAIKLILLRGLQIYFNESGNDGFDEEVKAVMNPEEYEMFSRIDKIFRHKGAAD